MLEEENELAGRVFNYYFPCNFLYRVMLQNEAHEILITFNDGVKGCFGRSYFLMMQDLFALLMFR